jgi:hypothetical protein
VYDGATISLQTLPPYFAYSKRNASSPNARNYSQPNYGRYTREQWDQLRSAVYVTYPYAKRAGIVINDINKHLATIQDESAKNEYLKSREKELRKEFTEPLTNMSIFQGRILMKLINRETGNNCYNIIKGYRGGLTARLYQTVAFFFDSNLKQPYDRTGDDAEIEKIVLEVARMYGYRS